MNLFIIISIFIQNDWGSALFGVVGGSLVWSSTELKEQAVRSELGWYPFNGKKIRPPFANAIARWKAPHL